MAKINFTSETLTYLKFSNTGRGYTTTEVDETLDKICQDYLFYEKFHAEAGDYIRKLEEKIGQVQKELNNARIENDRLTNRLQGINDNTKAGKENVDLLNYIKRLENALYAKGIDPTKI